MFEWIKKHRFVIAFSLIMIIAGVPFVIHVLFKIDLHMSFFYAEWTAGELLQYYAAILSFVSTLVLSVIALQYTIYTRDDEKKINYKITANLKDNVSCTLYYYNYKSMVITMYFDNYDIKYPDTAGVSYFAVESQCFYKSKMFLNIKNIVCSVRHTPNGEFEVVAQSYGSDLYTGEDVETIKKVYKYYQKGMITKEEYEKEGSIRISMTIGLCCSDIVTPMFFSVYLVPAFSNDCKYSAQFESKEIEYFRIGEPISKKEFLEIIK